VNTDFTIFLNKLAMGMVENHPLAVWLTGQQQIVDHSPGEPNPVQMDLVQQWFIYQLQNAKTWGNA